MLPSVEHDPTENKEIKKKYAKLKQNGTKTGRRPLAGTAIKSLLLIIEPDSKQGRLT